MRRALLVILTVAGVTWTAPAFAGGGGHGGVCYTEPTDLDKGWVGVLDSCFTPRDITISAGDTVRWKAQTSPGAHTVTFVDGPDSGPLQDGFAVRFNRPGTYRYSCIYHPGMVGSVEVAGDAAPGAAFEALDDDGNVATTFDLASAESTPASAVVIRLDPVAAAVILVLGLPLASAGALRLLGVRRPLSASRLRWRPSLRRDPVTER